jgi:hypothetical protein
VVVTAERDTWLGRLHDRLVADPQVTIIEPEPLSGPEADAAEWNEWRGFVGSKRVCPICGAVIGDPDLHAHWHEDQP